MKPLLLGAFERLLGVLGLILLLWLCVFWAL